DSASARPMPIVCAPCPGNTNALLMPSSLNQPRSSAPRAFTQPPAHSPCAARGMARWARTPYFSARTIPYRRTDMLTNTTQSYGILARALHWLVALLILGAVALGLYANNMPTGSETEAAAAIRIF